MYMLILNFTYPLRCLRIPPGVRVPPVEYHWSKRFKESWHVEITNEEYTHHFFVIKNIVHISFHKAKHQLSLLCGNVVAVTWSCALKRPELWPNDWIPHHDNAQTHKVLSVKQFLTQESITEIEHPLFPSWYGSELLLAVSRNKICLKGRNFVVLKTSKK
jgi:hypothetical protein